MAAMGFLFLWRDIVAINWWQCIFDRNNDEDIDDVLLRDLELDQLDVQLHLEICAMEENECVMDEDSTHFEAEMREQASQSCRRSRKEVTPVEDAGEEEKTVEVTPVGEDDNYNVER